MPNSTKTRAVSCLILPLLLILITLQASAVSGNLIVYSNNGDLVDNGNYDRWIKQFKKKYPSINKVSIIVARNYEVESIELFSNRSFGDVTMIPENIPKDVYPNYFEPLNELKLSQHVYFNDSWAYQGKEYGYSQGVSVEGLIYNKKIFKTLKLAVPQTLNELYTAAEVIAKAGITPLMLNIGSSWPLQQWDKAPIAIANDAGYYDKLLTNNRPFSTTGSYGKSLAIAHKFYQKGWAEKNIIEDNWDNSKTLFAEGKLAMYFLGGWAIPQLISKGINSDDVGFAPFPLTNNTPQIGLVNKDWGLAVSKFSRNKKAAKAWLKFLLTETDFADQSGFIPTDKRKKAKLVQMAEFQGYQPTMLQTQSPSFQFTRLTNMAGIDFMGGRYIRDILLSSNFEKSMQYWNRQWALALKNNDNTIEK